MSEQRRGRLDGPIAGDEVARARHHLDLADTRLAVAALHEALAVDPTFGPSFRRSAGLTGREATATGPQVDWWTTTLARRLGLPR